MRQRLDSFSTKEINLIQKLWNNQHSIQEISKLTNISYYEILFVLRSIQALTDVSKVISFTSFSDHKILFISDTHLGSIYENMNYIKEAYFCALDQDIKTVVHGGDLIQSMIPNVSKKYPSNLDQIYHVIEDYPYFPNIKNYILLGNHDYYALKGDDNYLEILKQREDFIFLGLKRAYFTWNNELISIGHSIDKYHLPIPSVDTFLNLRGHSHKLSNYKTRNLMLPSLSDDLIAHKDAKPGFLIGTFDKNELSFDSFSFQKKLYEDRKVFVKRK